MMAVSMPQRTEGWASSKARIKVVPVCPIETSRSSQEKTTNAYMIQLTWSLVPSHKDERFLEFACSDSFQDQAVLGAQVKVHDNNDQKNSKDEEKLHTVFRSGSETNSGHFVAS